MCGMWPWSVVMGKILIKEPTLTLTLGSLYVKTFNPKPPLGLIVVGPTL